MGIIPIVTRAQISARHLAKPGRLYFAYSILGEFKAPLSDADEELLDIIYYRLPSGAVNLKRTWRRRYAAIDAEVGAVIARHSSGHTAIRAHDMAASNAVTSLDWFETLQKQFAGRSVTLHASDLFDHVVIVAPPGTRWKVAFDPHGGPLQFIGRRLVLPANAQKTRFAGPLGQMMKSWLKWRALPAAVAKLATDGPSERISMFHPRAHAATKKHPGFTLGHHDLFRPEDKAYDVVRLMSTVKSLPADRISLMFKALSASVREGGLLVAGQNRNKKQPDLIPTTVFQRRENRFETVHEIMGGYDTRDLVHSLQLLPAAA